MKGANSPTTEIHPADLPLVVVEPSAALDQTPGGMGRMGRSSRRQRRECVCLESVEGSAGHQGGSHSEQCQHEQESHDVCG